MGTDKNIKLHIVTDIKFCRINKTTIKETSTNDILLLLEEWSGAGVQIVCCRFEPKNFIIMSACYKCGESGHFQRDCPNMDRGQGQSDKDCYKCGEVGHISRDCPNGPSYSSGGGGQNTFDSRTCYGCGRSGHISRDCPNGRQRGGGRQGGNNRSCYRCGESGHMARDCPSDEEKCYNCGKGGHL